MIKNILLLFIIVFIAWITKDYFSTNLPYQPKIDEHRIKTNFTIKKNKESSVEVEDIEKNILVEDELYRLLSENNFYDALAYYLEHTTKVNLTKLEVFLKTLSRTSPEIAIEYMKVLLDNEPDSGILGVLIETYISQGKLYEAITLIIDTKENYVSESEDKKLASQLRTVAIEYIDTLVKKENYLQLISFLEEMIAYDSTDNFYSFRLAQLYMKLDKVEEAGTLLDTLKYDEVYEQNVKSLLKQIDKEEVEKYEYAIPLERYGEHYVANVILDGNSFRLMLDTGASFIFIDEDKASMLQVIRDDLVLKTAGNDVQAKLAEASSLTLGNIQLSNIKVTLAPFEREGIDGLLGMNFFKRYIFFINQEESVLYLNTKH